MASNDHVWAVLPKFTGRNFQGWKRQVLVIMTNRGLIDHLSKDRSVKIEAGSTETQGDTSRISEDEKKETLAQGLLFSALDEKVMGQVQTCKTAFDIWKRLLLIYENASETNVDRLLQEYYSYIKLAKDDMATHISKIEAMADQLGSLGETQSERSVISKLLNSLPKEYDGFRNAWDSTHPDFRTKDELITRLMKQDVTMARGQSDSGKDVAMLVRGKQGKKKAKCYNCGIPGHFARDCRKPKKEKEQFGGKSQRNDSSKDTSRPEIGLTLASPAISGSLCASQPRDKWPDNFIMDSGASRHVTPRRDFFATYQPCDLELLTANNETIKAIGVGHVKTVCKVGSRSTKVNLYDVLHIPEASFNLFSVAQAAKNGAQVTFQKWGCKIEVDSQVIAVGKITKGSPIPILQAEIQVDQALAIQTKRPLADWHNSLGHADPKMIQEMASNKCVDGLEIAKQDESECTVCPMGKGTRAAHTMSSSFEAKQVGDRVDFDLIGPMREASLSNGRYILLTKDKYSGYSHLYLLKSKEETCDRLTEFLSQFENESGYRVKAVQTDNGSEFVNENVRRLFAVEHVAFRTSAPYTPEQNGTAERNNRVIIETARTLVAQGGLPSKLWAEAANTAVFLRNMIPKKGMKVTPFELFRGRRPSVGHIVPFGTRVHSLINDRRQGKFDSKTEPGVIVGFTGRTNTYRVYLPLKDTIKVTCDVAFRDHYLFERDQLDIDDVLPKTDNPVGIGLEVAQTGPGTSNTQEQKSNHILSDFFDDYRKEIRAETCWHDASSQISEIQSPSYSELTTQPGVGSGFNGQVVEITNEGSSLDEPPELESIRSHQSLLSSNSPGIPPELPSHNNTGEIQSQRNRQSMNSLLLLANDAPATDEPQTYQEAVTGPNRRLWQEAINSEKSAHETNGTWIVVKRPDSGTTLTAKWIFKIKRDTDGKPKRYKARLVARGYRQKAGIDYVETFAPVAKMDSIRTLLAVAAVREFHIEQFDVSTAFLNGDITDEIFMEPPEGIHTAKEECLKLKKALYGLKQAPRVWNSKFDQEVKKLKFTPLRTDPCVYISDTHDLFLGIYVDDGLVIGPSRERCVKIIEALNQAFTVNRIKDHAFLGIEILHTNDGLFLNQRRYILDIISRFNMAESKTRSAPMNDSRGLFVKDSEVLTDIPYREAIGSLLYCAMVTRPDILYPTVLLSRFNNAPEKKHWTAVKDLLRYLKGTSNLGLAYKRAPKLDINVFTDADWAGDTKERKSTSGLIITLGGSPVIFASRQQPTVALSSTEAEFVAACEGAKEILWLTTFLTELKIEHERPVMFVDNRSTIRMIKNNEAQKRTKHVDIKYHFVRDQHASGKFELYPVDTEAQLADFLTKALPGPKLAKLAAMANITCPP